MPIKLTLSKDDYAELLANNDKLVEEYVEDPKRAGGYVLAGAVGWESDEEITGLKTALKREREAVKFSSADKKEFGRLKQELDQYREKEQSDNDARQLYEQARAALAEEKKQRNIMAAVQANKGNIALNEYLQRRVVVDEQGKAHAVDPETKEPILSEDGAPMAVSDYVKHLLSKADTDTPELGALFYGTGSSGGGTPPGGGAKGTCSGLNAPGNLRRSNMTPRQKVDYVRAHGDKEYQRLPF